LKKYETTKLFWGEYLYKLSIYNQLAVTFREKNLPVARQALDKLQHEYENGNSLVLVLGIRKKPISEDHFLDAKKLYKIFGRFKNYKLRVENSCLSVYTNSLNYLDEIINTVNPNNLRSFYQPDPNFKDLDSNTIIVPKSNGYQYKVTLGTDKGDVAFGNWASNNPNLIKLGPVLKEELRNSGYVNGMYFYARDERTLQLCNLMLSNIRRIDKLVVK